MSQYFSFYLAKKDKDDVYHYLAPFKFEDGQFKPYALECRTRSFIDDDDFREAADCKIPLDKMDETLSKLCKNSDFFTDCDYSTGYAISLSAMYSLAKGKGMYVGYVTPEEAKMIVKKNYVLEDRYDVNLISPEVIAEQGKGDLVKMSFVAYNDTSYIADCVLKACSEILSWLSSKEEKDYYIVFETEY